MHCVTVICQTIDTGVEINRTFLVVVVICSNINKSQVKKLHLIKCTPHTDKWPITTMFLANKATIGGDGGDDNNN